MATHYSSCVNDPEDEGCPAKYPDVETDNTTPGRKYPKSPQRAATAYILWLKANRQKIIDEHFTSNGKCTLKGQNKRTIVERKAKEIWDKMDDESKKPFETQAAEEKADEFEGWLKYPTPVHPRFSNPKRNHYIGGYVSSDELETAGVKKYYKNWDEAVVAAIKLGSSICGGITRDYRCQRYSLRKVGPLKEQTDPKRYNTVSWKMK